MGTITTTGYGLRHKKTGLLARLAEQEDQTSEGLSYRLMAGDVGDVYPEFEVDTPDKAALALVINTPWYNSTPAKPGWDKKLNMAEYEVAQIVRVSSVEVTACDVPVPVRFGRDVEHRRTMRRLAERYLGHAIADEHADAELTFIVVRAPEGETVDSLKTKCTNRPVLMGEENDYPELCLGVFTLPLEYADLFKDGRGVGLILTHFAR
jgi:hypothetical protein